MFEGPLADVKERICRLIVPSRNKNLIKVKARDLDRRIDRVELVLRILLDQWLKDPRLYLSVKVIANDTPVRVEGGVEANEKWPVIALRLDFNFRVDIFKIYFIIA